MLPAASPNRPYLHNVIQLGHTIPPHSRVNRPHLRQLRVQESEQHQWSARGAERRRDVLTAEEG